MSKLTRRGIFGFMVGAPLAAPAIAKALAQPPPLKTQPVIFNSIQRMPVRTSSFMCTLTCSVAMCGPIQWGDDEEDMGDDE